MLPEKNVTFTPVTSCLNCGNPLTDKDFFCNICGAKKIEERFTPKRIVKEAGERVFNIDNTFLRTFKDLFVRPEKVIDGFLAGLRKRYFNAFSYFTIAITISGLQVFVLKKFYPEVVEQMGAIGGNPNAISQAIQDSTMEYQPVIMFATIPFLALMGFVAFLTLRKHNYTEHLIIQLYTYSHLSIVTTLIGLTVLIAGGDYLSFGLFTVLIYIGYNAYVYKRLYQLSIKGIILRTLFFLLLLLVLYVVISVAVVVLTLLIDPELFKEMIQQQQTV